MRVLGKAGDEIHILAMQNEEIHRGDYLLLEDQSKELRLVVQAYDETYLDIPGLSEEILRDEVIGISMQGIEEDPMDVRNISFLIRDSRVLKCKMRGMISDSRLKPASTLLPSRVHTRIRKLSLNELFTLVDRKGGRAIEIGYGGKDPIEIFAESLDGRINIVTGKKESGKSHLSKLLAGSLVKLGASLIVFDLNDEYKGLAVNKNGTPSSLSERTIRLEPGRSMKFDLKDLGLRAICNVLQNALDLPGASMREFIRIWKSLVDHDSLNSESLGNALVAARTNEFVRDALIARYHTLRSTGLLSDGPETLRLEEIVGQRGGGVLILISLARLPPLTRKIAVELVLSKLVDLLEFEKIRPIFLFAEEAHLYLRETYWDDIVTRMRHFGIFTTFITNQPDAISHGIYRQCDNVFLFNFTNDADIELVSKAAMVDAETVKSIVRTLPPRSCLVLGRVVADLPIVVQVIESEWNSMGETKLFFSDMFQEHEKEIQASR